ncbi:MAG: beta-Ala-His dipeptidase [Candidatus Heimdallarchaeaceae archaeon]
MSENVLSSLKPKIVWSIFEELTKIPRPSKKEEKVRLWIENWAKEKKIKYKVDDVGNLLLSQKATAGCVNYPTLILQGHMDMVCQKTKDSKVDCASDSLILETDGKKVYALGTSLGADNGIGVAMCLASLITEEIGTHGPLEVLLTVDEETGLTGAFNMKRGFFSGDYLLNLDSEVLGEITISSAGGGSTYFTFPAKKETLKNYKGMKIEIHGLQGGHSGIDIDKNRINAIKVGADALNQLIDYLKDKQDGDLLISNISGGTAHNAIPREFSCDFFVPKSYKDICLKILKRWKKHAIATLKDIEPNIIIDFSNTKLKEAYSSELSRNLCSFLSEVPHGVISYSEEIKDLVQTSNNLAIIKSSNEQVKVELSTRSAEDEELTMVRENAKAIGEKYGAEVVLDEAYPGWKSNLESSFLKIIKENYENVLGRDVELKAIHAGLECGLFLKLKPELEVSSIGPTIKNVHSPREYVEVKSVEILWEVLKKVIESMNNL